MTQLHSNRSGAQNRTFGLPGEIGQLWLRRKRNARRLRHRVLLQIERRFLQLPRQMVNFPTIQALTPKRVKAVTFGEEVLDRSRPGVKQQRRSRAIRALQFCGLRAMLSLGNVVDPRFAPALHFHASLANKAVDKRGVRPKPPTDCWRLS